MSTATGTREAALAAHLRALVEGRSPPPLHDGFAAGDEAWAALVAETNRLTAGVAAVRTYAIALGDGRLDYDPPAYDPLIGPLKALQANLRHLTWQAQQVADGRLDQRVDFMGEFSAAFNRMIDSLRSKERAEAEALRAASLAGIGQLASGLAHELNSATQYIGDNLSYLQDGLSNLAALRSSLAAAPPTTASAEEQRAWALDRIESAAESAAAVADGDLEDALSETIEGARHIERVVHAMSEFSQAGDESSQRTDLNSAVENTLVVSSHAWHQVATVELDLQDGLPKVAAQPAEVCQVVLQLVLNAAQAIGGAGECTQGRIRIGTSVDGAQVVLTVADSGPGVSPELRPRLFDLFFTTKVEGQGRGLGLCTCHEIVVARLGGKIEVGDGPGGGALFTVRLPVAT